MVVVLKPDTKEEQIENLKVWLSSMGISTHISRGVNHTIVGLVGDTSVVDMDLVRALDIVENVQRIQEPFKNANRKFHNADQVVDIAAISRLSQALALLKAKRRFVKSQKESKRQVQVCCVAAHSSPEPPPTHSRV